MENMGSNTRRSRKKNTHFYNKFVGMKSRCLYGRYKNVDIAWKYFSEFKNDMYESYMEHVKLFGERETTLDRIDNSKGYCKANCRWATFREQYRNKTTNIRIMFRGKELVLKDIAEKIGVPYKILWQRLTRDKMSFDNAIKK